MIPSRPRARMSPNILRLVADEPVDLAIAEQPGSVQLHHVVGVAAGRTDLRPLLAVLHGDPVGEALRRRAVQLDDDVRDMMDRARPRPGATDPAHQRLDAVMTGALAERG